MSRAQAFQVYRSCAASFSSRGAARSSLPLASRRLAGVRYYSEGNAQSSENAEASKSESQKSEEAKDSGASPAETECLEKLKKKEAEVTDLTVRIRDSCDVTLPY